MLCVFNGGSIPYSIVLLTVLTENIFNIVSLEMLLFTVTAFAWLIKKGDAHQFINEPFIQSENLFREATRGVNPLATKYLRRSGQRTWLKRN